MFNLDNYEPVEDRIRAFYKDYPDGRIHTEINHYSDSRIVITARIYRNTDDVVWTTGIAEETRGEGGTVNNTSHVENCETSAIGRALANANYATKARPSREEMQKAGRETKSKGQEKSTGTERNASKKQVDYIGKLAHRAGLSVTQLNKLAEKKYNTKHHEITTRQASELIEILQKKAGFDN